MKPTPISRRETLFFTVAFFALALVFCACKEGASGEGNSDSKFLVIEHPASGSNFGFCGVFDTLGGIAIANNFPMPPHVDNGRNEVRYELFQVDTQQRWKGNGPHFVCIRVKLASSSEAEFWYTDGAEWTAASDTRKPVNFNQTVTRLDFSKFKKKT
jgi:hypothetical protein